jgi:hypothetical protein
MPPRFRGRSTITIDSSNSSPTHDNLFSLTHHPLSSTLSLPLSQLLEVTISDLQGTGDQIGPPKLDIPSLPGWL